MQKKPYICPAIEIIEIDIKRQLTGLVVSGQTGNTVDDWDGKETDFDDADEGDFQRNKWTYNPWDKSFDT